MHYVLDHEVTGAIGCSILTSRTSVYSLAPTPRSAVDKLMSEDIQKFMATGADRSDRAAKPPRVFSSPSLAPTSHKHSHALMESYPRKSLVFPSGRETQALGGFKTARDEENHIKPYLRDLALGPLTYTGSAELRGGTPPISSQPVMPVRQ